MFHGVRLHLTCLHQEEAGYRFDNKSSSCFHCMSKKSSPFIAGIHDRAATQSPSYLLLSNRPSDALNPYKVLWGRGSRPSLDAPHSALELHCVRGGVEEG